MRTYDMTEAQRSLSIVFSSDLDLVPQAVKDSCAFLASHASSIDAFAFKLALFEGLTNAVKHGCRSDSSKIVRLLVEVPGACVNVTISDDGEGFDWRSLLSNDSLVSPESDSGRGIFLLKSYNCHPSYNEKGNVLTIRLDPE